MFNGTPLFPGQNEEDELDQIFKKLGTPTVEEMPQLLFYPKWNPNQEVYPAGSLHDLVPRMDPIALDLLSVVFGIVDEK